MTINMNSDASSTINLLALLERGFFIMKASLLLVVIIAGVAVNSTTVQFNVSAKRTVNQGLQFAF